MAGAPHRAAFVLAAVTLAAGTGSATARIVPGKSIAGVGIGMTDAQVRAQVGKPTGVSTRKGYRIWDYTRRKTLWLRVVIDQSKHVVELYTTARRERTKDGLGVGSTKAQLQHRLKGEQCSDHIASYGSGCMLGSLKHGRFTVFELSPRDVVNEVVVGKAGAPS